MDESDGGRNPQDLTQIPRLLSESECWAGLRAAIQTGQAGAIDGAWGSSAAAAVAALAGDVAGPLLVVVPSLTEVQPWTEDLASFLGKRPSVFAAYETWPIIERTAPAPETSRRLALLQQLLNARELDFQASPHPMLAPLASTSPTSGEVKNVELPVPNSTSPLVGEVDVPTNRDGGWGVNLSDRPILLASIASLLQPVPPPSELAARSRRLAIGMSLDPEDLGQWLSNAGYQRTDAVERPGEYSRRGGLLDIFPADATDPVRLEFFGDELESLRSFAPQTQRSLGPLVELVLIGLKSASTKPAWGFFGEYLPKSTTVALVEPNDLHEQARFFFDRIAEAAGLMTFDGAMAQLLAFPTVTVSSMPRGSVEATAHLRIESVERFSGQVQKVREELEAIARYDRVLIACQSEAEVKRLGDVLKVGQLAESDRLRLVTGHVRKGFRLILDEPRRVSRPEGVRKTITSPLVGEVDAKRRVGGETSSNLLVLGSHELFHKELLPPGVKQPGVKGRRIESRAIDSFLDLNDGDYVVHIAHGIARFRGMTMLEKGRTPEGGTGNVDGAGAAMEEHLVLEFRDKVMLYVPATRIDLVQRYVGGTQAAPPLSKLGSASWGRKKDKVSDAVRDMAAEMIQIQAMRAALPGTPLPPDSDWQREFEAAFPYQETPDQATSIVEIKNDLERSRPMDRLLCGDVGYGKTEVAVRAAFKAIDNGKQVAILVPTTVLAEQHFRTFGQRLAEYPFTIECLSRFRTAKQQKEILKRAREGALDILVGTHRVVSKDVGFKDLGLVIIDEEQRFGVEHKERLKMLRTSVPILTMTATPIPRTLHGALLGIREISSLETPPPGRTPVETRIIRWDDALIRHAIHRELNRGGQVYFVHNRIYDIDDIAAKVQSIVPEAKIVIGHGQMGEGELEKAMLAFVRKEADILVATTIIESGLDIPSANTMFIDDADIYGLADLHQLRGRVGRTQLRAYAYLIVQEAKMVTPNAQKRLKAIEEFTELGSGFKIAMRDLEIRGAGNILGTQQSGHIAAVGYEMYCQLLENAIRQLKQQPPKEAVEVNVDLPWPAYLPKDYVPGQKLRIEVYRRLARLRDPAKLDDFRSELRDRYGPLPEPVEWLLRTTEIRLLCLRWQLGGLHRVGMDIFFAYRNRKKAEQLEVRTNRKIKIIDDSTMSLRLKPEDDAGHPAIFGILKGLLG